ncbi:hypothetical protein [Bifidobacterium sp. ESL0745]|uniref:hypothetical protein n=1 Tax=Bifidobacterium sp. ESL0745 TaxID=2983226 RepID=UPI0023F9BE3C|nr:hypothetical protein [Bifidobacterium sp. ESL0745]MDF7665347.1 hypothetical protein [Bifidobacterium sp. ESL0745]
MSEFDPKLLPLVLKDLGWRMKSEKNGLAQMWFPKEAFSYESFNSSPSIILPIENGTSKTEYNSLIRDAYLSLEKEYGDRFETTYAFQYTKTSESLDTIKTHVDTGSKSGLIRWEDGKRLFDSTRNMLISAAKASDKRKSYYGNGSATIAESVLKGSYMGQTQIGSYIVTAYVPAYKQFQLNRTTKKNKMKSIPGRTIIHTLDRALEGLLSGVEDGIKEEEDKIPEIFSPLVQQGVSFELVSSISEMVESSPTSKATTIQINLETRPMQPKIKPKVFELEHRQLPVLKKAEQVLKETKDKQSAKLLGEVILLKHSSHENDHEIKLSAIRDNKLRQIQIVALDSDQYEQALEAHGNGKLLEVAGTLIPQTRGYFMEHPTHVSISKTDI